MEKMGIFSERSERYKEIIWGFEGIFSERSERYQKYGAMTFGNMVYGCVGKRKRG